MNKTIKKKEINNKTKKNKDHILKTITNITDEQKEIICKKVPSTFKSFEEKVDELFEKNNIDVTSSSFNLEKQIIKEIKKAVSPSNITPNDDFYSYINERWLKNLDIEAYQEYITQIDDFRLTQDKVYREIIQIVENYLSDPKTRKTDLGKCIGNAYESFKSENRNTIEQTRHYVKLNMEYIEELRKDPKNVWTLLANVNSNEIIAVKSPFVWSINPDEKNPTTYKCYLEGPEVSLIDIDVYFDYDDDTEEDKKYKSKYRKRYFKYLNDLFDLAFGENHKYDVKDIFKTEAEIVNAMNCELIKMDEEELYNLITKEEAINNFGFDWSEFCKILGLKKVPNDFVTSNVNYLLCGTKLLKEKWNSEQWKTYWIYICICQAIRWNVKGADIYFQFHGKFVRGMERLPDDYIVPFFGTSFTFNSFLTEQYVIHYKNQQAIDYVKAMVEDLRRVFIRIIKRNGWMEKKTKKTAIEKLEHLKLKIGSPEVLLDDPLLDYKPNDPWGNLVKKALWRHEKAIGLVGEKVIDIPVIDWSHVPPKLVSTQAYVVNAMYTPTENSIYIPLGYIQKPFVDLDERGIEYNLSRIGYTIAHELSHSLDDLGSKYDKDGKLHNWWTKKDSEQFKKIQKDIVKQYEEYAKRDGIVFDAWPSIGEDLADISGFIMCLEYLRDFQLKNQDILPIQTISFQAFFIYYALQSRQKISKKAIVAQLKTNPHPPDKYRCNVPLSRSKVFRAMFKIKKGDNMWWNSTNAVWID
jgi:predicted metalloendopeptidase